MYTIHVDGKLIYSTGADDIAQIALNVKPSLDVENAGSLSFVLPPGNALHGGIRKMKSIITMHQDGELIFRGRATEVERDSFNQVSVYCEGDRSFLLDSLWEEQVFEGKVQAFFRMLISNHNGQVEREKQFTPGIITAVDAQVPYEAEFRVETRKFWDTSTVLEDRLLAAYGGYIRTRTVGGVTYMDWLADFEDEADQPIRFGVNLLDLKDKLDASDVFTCLIPLGYSEIGKDGTYEDPVTIESVNGGKEYIVDEEAVALYGRIWRTKTWAATKEPAALKEKAEQYMKTGAEIRTLTLSAVDMHFTDGDISMLKIGTKVEIDSQPNGIHLRMVLAKMDIDPDNPDKTQYTFGVKPRALSEAVIRTDRETSNLSGSGRGGGGGGGRSIQQEAQDIFRWATITADQANANINLNAGEINKLTGEMSQAEINIDGLNSEITLKANKVYVDAQITQVKKLIADEIEAAISDINLSISETIVTNYLTVTGRATLSALALGGSNVSKTTIPVVTSFTQASGESAPRTNYTLLTTDAGSDEECTAGNGETVTF